MLAVLRDFGKNAFQSISTCQVWLENLSLVWRSTHLSNTWSQAVVLCRKSHVKISRSLDTKRIHTLSSWKKASSLKRQDQSWMATWQVCLCTCFSHMITWILWIFVVSVQFRYVMFWWFVYHSLLDGLWSRSKRKMLKKWWKHILVFSRNIVITVLPSWKF